MYANEYGSNLRSYKHYFSFRPELYPGLIFHFCLSSFRNCEDRFHIHFCICSSHVLFPYIHGQKLRQVALILT